MNKKITLIVIALLIIAGSVYFFFLNKEESIETKKEPNVKEEKKEVDKMGFNERLDLVVQKKYFKHNKGYIFEGYQSPLNKDYFLTINQRGIYQYNEDYPGENLLWTKESDGEVEITNLSRGDKLVHLVKDKEEPFITSKGETFIVFYEREGTIDYGYNGKGYVYKIKPNGDIKEIYKTKGSYYGVLKNEDGNLVFVEKIFRDDRNMNPTFLKPYDLYFKQYVDEKWIVIKKEFIDPSVQKEKE